MRQSLPYRNSGWTFVEMLVAISLSAVFMGAAALVFSAITTNSKRLTTVMDLNIGSANKANFYSQSGDTVLVYQAPNYGKAAYVQDFRDLLLEDASYSSSIYCLPRSVINTVRPEFLTYDAGVVGTATNRPRLDTPEAFRQFLATVEPTSAAIYDSSIRNVPATAKPNTSIYFLAPETDPGYIRVRAVYEIDFVTPTNLTGTYVSVRRYKNGALTHYYDIYYAAGAGDAFQPGFVAFERKGRLAVDEGSAIDRFKVSNGSPFYLIWLPDPAINPYSLPAWTAADPATSPRAAYEKMTGKTSFLISLPLFPSF
ncbi:MAG TPA: prepilin-type N-terminal cleavage/methylation domain-containing protein [Verrucomicrobiales bacterium]|nr:prepilin-type N-terminal cleavage/methylation domain-containing protein [Verrucomicrobiales bacterium]